MFARVRRGELVLAATGVVGVVAGLVLTIAAKFGVTGPVLIGVGVLAAAAGAVAVIRTQVAGLVDRQRQQRDRLDAILAVPLQALADVDPFRIGVFPSALAQEATPDAPGPGVQGAVLPPYVRRGVDDALGTALE